MAKAEINAKDIEGNTPVHFCAKFGHKDCLRYILLQKPSLLSKNNQGKIPIDLSKNEEIVEVSK